MSWFAAGAAAVGVVTSVWQGRQQAKAAARAESAQIQGQSEAESRAIIRDRLNQTVRNSYQAAMLQSQLALQRQKAAKTSADIRSQGLVARGTAEANRAASGVVGASAQAVAADIDSKVNAATAQTQLELQQSLDNYNAELDMIVVNTAQSAPEGVRDYRSTGNYGSDWRKAAGVEILSGLAQFGFGYAQRRMQLGPGTTPAPRGNVGQGITRTPQTRLRLGSGAHGLRR